MDATEEKNLTPGDIGAGDGAESLDGLVREDREVEIVGKAMATRLAAGWNAACCVTAMAAAETNPDPRAVLASGGRCSFKGLLAEAGFGACFSAVGWRSNRGCTAAAGGGQASRCEGPWSLPVKSAGWTEGGARLSAGSVVVATVLASVLAVEMMAAVATTVLAVALAVAVAAASAVAVVVGRRLAGGSSAADAAAVSALFCGAGCITGGRKTVRRGSLAAGSGSMDLSFCVGS